MLDAIVTALAVVFTIAACLIPTFTTGYGPYHWTSRLQWWALVFVTAGAVALWSLAILL